MAFSHLLRDVAVHRFGIEIDANRAEQARVLGIETLQANTMDVRCPPEAVSACRNILENFTVFGDSRDPYRRSIAVEPLAGDGRSSDSEDMRIPELFARANN